MSRRSKKKLTNRTKVLITVALIAICLFIIHGFNSLTKSADTNTTQVKFIESGATTEHNMQLEIVTDENGKTFIMLPEKVNNLYTEKFILSSEIATTTFMLNTYNQVEENSDLENEPLTSNETSTNTVEEITSNENNSQIQNNNENENNTVTENTNTVIETNTIVNQEATNTVSSKNTVNNTTNTIASEMSKDAETEENIVSEVVSGETQNKLSSITDENSENIINTDKENTASEENINLEGAVENKNTNTVNDVTNTISNTVDNTNLNTVSNENDDNEDKIENTTNTIEDETVDKAEDIESGVFSATTSDIDNLLGMGNTFREFYPGDRIYLDEETITNNSLSLEVVYQTKETNGVKLYNQDLIASSTETNNIYEVKLTGYAPLNSALNFIKLEEVAILENIDGVEEFNEANSLFGFDISISDEAGNIYQPINYGEHLTLSIVSDTYLKDKMGSAIPKALHFKVTDTQEIIEKISITNKTENSVEFYVDEFSEYAIVAIPKITANTVVVDDYESDYNYYMGLNYTEDNSGKNSNKYNDNNLIKVNLNYYGYDPEFVVSDLVLNTSSWSSTTTSQVNNYVDTDGTSKTIYTSTITATVETSGSDFIEKDSTWKLEFSIPTGTTIVEKYVLDNNQGKIDSIIYDADALTATIANSTLANWTENSATSYTISFNVAFESNTRITAPTVKEFTAEKRHLVGKVSATENQTLFSYIKAVPADNSNNVSIELIDNPYMDRPEGAGFDGWTSHNTSATFSLNSNTYVQTLTMNTNGAKEITIDMYANWTKANIVFVSSAGASGNSGYTLNKQKSTTAQAAGILDDDYINATNASNRELNIVVITQGNFTDFDSLNDTGLAYTLTSLYNGTDYRDNTSFSCSSNEIVIENDLQLHHLNWGRNGLYYNDNGNDALGYRIIGNTRNLRIGRGMTPSNANYGTFAQVQGGHYSTYTARREHKLVIESGKYTSVQLTRSNGGSRRADYTCSGTLVYGCDYDRVLGDNDNLRIYMRVSSKTGGIDNYPGVTGKPAHFVNVKSGTLGMDYFNSGGEDMAYSGIYVSGVGYAGDDYGDRVLLVEGGEIANIIGGLATPSNTTVKTKILIKGGSVQNIVGGAGLTQTYGDRIIQVTGGEIAYSISGGSNGYLATTNNETGNNGRLNGNTLIYVGGNAVVGTKATTEILYDVNAGCVLGAGNGASDYTAYSGLVYSSHVIIDGNAKINNNVYGGGNFGKVSRATTNNTAAPVVTFTKVTSNFEAGVQYLISTGNGSGNGLTANGTNLASTTVTNTQMPSSNMIWYLEDAGNGRVYIKNSNGNYLYVSVSRWGWVSTSLSATNKTAFSIASYGNGVRISCTVNNNTYYLRYSNRAWSCSTNTNNSTLYLLKFERIPVEVDTEKITKIDIFGGTVVNDVYAGANNNDINGSIGITMTNGNVQGAIYGGSNTTGTIGGVSIIKISGGNIGLIPTQDSVFGGGKGDETGIAGLTDIKITDENNNVKILGNIYGGSALGDVNGDSTITVEDKSSDINKIEINGNVYGGGKGETGNAASTTGNATVNVDGGTYSGTSVFGGCNVNGTIGGAIRVNIGSSKSTLLNEVYGGGNKATVTADTDNVFVYLYKNANVVNAFNGGNSAGIAGTNDQTPRTIYAEGATVGNLYGGSNETGDLTQAFVKVSEYATISNIYGGGYGENAKITGDTSVQIVNSTIKENVYGGGNDGSVGGSTDVDINTSTVDGNVFGAGKGELATVSENAVLDITETTVYKNVYGGGDNGPVTKNTDIYLNDTDVGESVYAGGKGTTAIVSGTTLAEILNNSFVIGSVYGGGNAGQVVGSADVIITAAEVEGSVFGGGKAASVASTDVNIQNSNILTNVYGGGEEGEITSDENGNSTVVVIGNSTTTNVYGGGDKGNIAANSNITILENSQIAESVYGGGNQADVGGITNVAIDLSTVGENVYGGGNAGAINGIGLSTTVSVLGSNIGKSIFGGGNQGEVVGDTNLSVGITADAAGNIVKTVVTENIYGGGNEANVNGTTVTVSGETTTQNIYGGGNLGEVTEDTRVYVSNSIIQNNIYGGGSGSQIAADGTKGAVGGNIDLDITDNTIVNNKVFGGGQGITAIVNGDIDLRFEEESTVTNDIYGGGDNGPVSGSTEVYISSGKIGGSAYAAGNGSSAKVSGSSYILAEGATTIGKSIFGGGNAAETGTIVTDASGKAIGQALTIVDIAGAEIGENVYGGANSSVINGSTVTNIGIEASNRYYGADQGFEKGKITISGTVFGGGENMDLTSDDFNYDAISVTETILINVDGNGYDTSDTDPNTISIAQSIFGSGNASSAKTNGDINIRNYGTQADPKRGISIQRASNVLIDNSSLLLNGTTDSTSEFASEYFTLNRISSLKIKNNTNLYLVYGANLLAKFDSMVGEDGNEEYAKVEIIDEVTGSDGNTYRVKNGNIYDSNGDVQYYVKAGAIYEPAANAGDEDTKIADVTDTNRASTVESRNVDNRIYMYSGRNLNISNSEYVTSEYGDVKGMTFFGIFKSSSGESGDASDTTPDEEAVYTGMYSPNYTVGGSISWAERNFTRSYVLGLHQKSPEQDITQDGFYTVYEELTFELEDDEILTEDIYDATSYISYIDPTPEDDVYYMWYAGPDEEIFYYTISLLATKHSTIGSKELSLLGISYENAELTMSSFDATLIEGVGLYDKNSIPNINTDQEAANNNYGLTMKTGNTGWSMTGATDFYADAVTADNNQVNAKYDGTEEYTIENLKTTPLLNFYFYHSNNIDQKRDLGTCQINMNLSYWRDALNRGNAKVIIDVILSSDTSDDVGYNGSIAPGAQYDLFTTSVTNVTTKSSFSTFFELAQPEFSKQENIEKYYENSYRVFTTEYAFPAGTTITMIDRWNKNNPEYYYYTVTEADYNSGKVEYRFTEFKSMGSSNEPYNEIEARKNYYINENNLDYQYENFIFITNFENATFTDIVEGQSLITKGQHFRIYLKADDPETKRTEILFGLIDAQIPSMVYGIYDTESTIEVEADLNKRRIFLGSDMRLNVDTIYNVKKGEQSVIIHDTRYFDKKLGIKLTFYRKNDDGVYEVVTGANLLGTYFELNGEKYYPRADGTTRIKIAELVSNASSTIKIGTENSSISTGEYQILVESFGSADGIYYGVEASDSAVVNVEIINDVFGLNSTLPEHQVIIDKTTGHTLDTEGYISEDLNALDFKVEYVSGLNNPYIAVSLYRRNYDENIDNPYDNTYTKVDLADYVNETLEAPIEVNQAYDVTDEEFIESIKYFDKEYKAIDTQTIKNAVTDETVSVTLNSNYTLKENLTSGTYKVVFTLYDASSEVAYKQEVDDKGNITQKEFAVTEYAKIGDTFSYIIIK